VSLCYACTDGLTSSRLAFGDGRRWQAQCLGEEWSSLVLETRLEIQVYI
jgi:hypothetical protein